METVTRVNIYNPCIGKRLTAGAELAEKMHEASPEGGAETSCALWNCPVREKNIFH